MDTFSLRGGGHIANADVLPCHLSRVTETRIRGKVMDRKERARTMEEDDEREEERN
jgi:hypothetical protein